MHILVAVVFSIIILFINSTSMAQDCRSQGSDPCVCSCQKLGRTAESEGRGICRVIESHRNFCSLIWNRGNKKMQQSAVELGKNFEDKKYTINNTNISDGQFWSAFQRFSTAQNMGLEQAAIFHFNRIDPREYDIAVTQSALLVLIHAHVSSFENDFDLSAEIINGILSIIWRYRKEVVSGMKTKKEQTQEFEDYEVTTNFGCISIRRSHHRVMVKSPFAEGRKGAC